MEDMVLGRDWRSFLLGSMGDPSLGTMKVMENLKWWTSFLANSASGIRWPIPGVGTMAI